MAVYKLKNQIQDYAWGSKTAIPDLLGYKNDDDKPMAELWMGAHPKAPSGVIMTDGSGISLDRFIDDSPLTVLGGENTAVFGPRLPFLFKVLAAETPLSIQAHPNLSQAREGFERENAAGISLDAFNRNYKDNNHKPEIICALTEYHAMCGFRNAAEIAANFRMIMVPALDTAVSTLEAEASAPDCAPDSASDGIKGAIRTFFTAIMQLDDASRRDLVGKAVKSAAAGRLPASDWIIRFSELYPGDTGILSPVYLNVVTLKPGEAMFLPAGELHAYLNGLGIELMANSDNVLRGGLTPKYVDVPELLSTLTFEPVKPEILKPVPTTEFESVYETQAGEFLLSRIELNGTYILPETGYKPSFPSIFICLEGELEIFDNSADGKKNGAYALKISRGDSVFATFGSGLKLEGKALLYRASVPVRDR